MLSNIIKFSLNNKLIILLFTFSIVAFGIYAVMKIPIGAVPDVTNNQVQVITTSRNLSTQDVEQFLTYPVELEMANLPGVKEIRSVSKFGLSVVTIVFEDRMGTYLPRQLISEKIKTATENIPEGFGTPEMGPITTGLGEIYQYVLDVDSSHRSDYSTMDLRTIQDWIVKRQLSGIPGVVEVNTWGGFLKQYEVSLNPKSLRAMNLSVYDIFEALQSNNSLAGGGYIEKDDKSYFIRGEGLTKNIEDIENIVVENRSGRPIFIKDIAVVQYGYATRFGAITGNGEGEKVLGQVMMLKGADSKDVIESVKERVSEVQKTLPPGIYINPILERSDLIHKTTSTITENLILGCLIVVFVVILLLGNWRSGLIVASVIPLCLLFAISLMYLFGIDANLMSLGAIDFGIIIDGAVIIVEYIAFKVSQEQSNLQDVPVPERKTLLDRIAFNGTNKMMHSAIFGQLIIIIVFIPVLSLVNVEGKMFRPMALTFCFALIGAMILCFTYIPVISSMFLKPVNKNFSHRFIGWLKQVYQPMLYWALRFKGVVITGGVALLLGAGIIFFRLGGEFVPTLDEGDFVIQPVLETGTSLTKTIEIITAIEQVLKSFPEVNQVVTRIGAAEVPTDPMSMEETDVIITLNPKDNWVSAGSKDELANVFKEALTDKIPGVDYEFTQPIEMRFNELITGVRADIAIKIFGEDLEILANEARRIEKLIQHIDGASDIIVEKIEGLPQMEVSFNRGKIARYGLNIAEVNDVIRLGFGGMTAGSVFEGEKKFDLVARFERSFNKDIESLHRTFVTAPDGFQVPLDELALISYTTGPAKISRDNTKRRIVVSVNVRNRDLESVVDDIRQSIDQHIKLPPGYYVDYGGQFENLQSARKRLGYAVPVALILIFILLHFAFKSIKDALMVYSAIPLSAVGGVIFLWIRGMPFSISAGVGFIALFGIAVLNGIVLIEHYKELGNESKESLREIIVKGTLSRLRPVLLTASAAALGFLPMAVSTSAGAEVQRPLATVVIGGLFSATVLTLIVLPVLYCTFQERSFQFKWPRKKILLTFIFFTVPLLVTSQVISVDEAVRIAKENNAALTAEKMRLDKQTSLLGTAFDLDKTGIYYSYDENNIAPNNSPLRVFGVQQSLKFPSTYGSQFKLNKEQVNLASASYEIKASQLEGEVRKSFFEIVYLENLYAKYLELDSIYEQFSNAANRKFELGESNVLETLTAKSQQNEIQLALNKVQKDIHQAYLQLYELLQVDDSLRVGLVQLERIALEPFDSINHPGIQFVNQQEVVTDKQRNVVMSNWLPDLQLEYFIGSNNLPDAQNYQGFQVGLALPLFFSYQKSMSDASKIEMEQVKKRTEGYLVTLKSRRLQLELEASSIGERLDYYDDTGSELADALLIAAQRSFKAGEIDYLEYVQTLDRGVKIQINYLHELNKYNQTVITLNFLME